ncbi:hypothetical protein CL1_1705 [Thermococcus cleftensis]|uniref:Uncharacterized protein n=1 Tax=Thermococcus cleftensis (strain DSM 27260 / KACC 17922 / CL1) TaxID=163003 RepID=I3ZW18_THECF|nr:hypothetical protein [Thermococcus cleftensis]AFL95902.1 hypothetical protein CL1_1705 [Thermococcus cleftensis]
MRKSSKVIFALAFLLVAVPFVDCGIAEFLLRDVPEVPVVVGTPVTYGIYFPKTYAVLEAGRNGEIVWRAGDTLYVRTSGDLNLPTEYDYRPQIQELIENRSAEIQRILEEVKDGKGNWNASELYLRLSHVVWLNESISEYGDRLGEASVELFPVVGTLALLQGLVITLAGVAFAFEIRDFADREPAKALAVAVLFSALLLVGYAFIFAGYPFNTVHHSIPEGFLAGIQPVERNSSVSPPCLESWYVRATPEVERIFREHLLDNPPVYADDPDYSVHYLELWLNESERDALFSELESLGAVWVWDRECWDRERLATLNETEALGRELLDRGYIDERDFRGLEALIDAERKRIMEMKFPARYRVMVSFVAG